MKYEDIKRLILQFNADNTATLIREKYATETFFDIIDKSRSETTHSAFIAWLLSNVSTCHDENNRAIVRFLDLLVNNANQQEANAPQSGVLMESALANAIMMRQLKVSRVSAATECAIASLAGQAVADYAADNDHQQLLLQIAKNVQDRADIVVDCEVEGLGDVKTLQIIIENKIDSAEGGAKAKNNKMPECYAAATQTARYYMASKRNCKSVAQLYVFLSPSMDMECKSEHYIQITYQDILDSIIEPTLLSPSLSPRVRMYIEDYKDEITFPHATLESFCPCLAFARQDYTDNLSALWEKFRELVFTSMAVANRMKLWYIHGHYYLDLNDAKEAALKELIPTQKDWLVDNGFISESRVDKWKPSKDGSFCFNTRKALQLERLKEEGVKDVCLCDATTMDEMSIQLLSDFWETNCLFIASLSSYLLYTPFAEDKALLDVMLQKRDTTKYNVYFDGEKVNDKVLGKGETAFAIIQVWVDYMKSRQPSVGIEDVRKYFPVSLHQYYQSRKWFKYLFYPYKENGAYEYDGDMWEGDPVTSGWDFYADKKHVIALASERVTMLKMWRKENLENLLQHITNKGDDFSNRLVVVQG